MKKQDKFFVIETVEDGSSFEVREVRGILFKGTTFKRENRLFGLSVELYVGGRLEWYTYDIETGLCIVVTEFLPATLEDLKMIGRFVEDFDRDNADDDRKRYAEAIKRAYDEHPEIKRQVFG